MKYVYGLIAVFAGLATIVCSLACRLFGFGLSVALAICLVNWLFSTSILVEFAHVPWLLLWLFFCSLGGVLVAWLTSIIFGALAVEAF
jgi:hypothetical protein